MSSKGETCDTVIGMRKSEEVIENGHLWWPLGVRWPQSKGKANLTEIVTDVTVSTASGHVSEKKTRSIVVDIGSSPLPIYKSKPILLVLELVLPEWKIPKWS